MRQFSWVALSALALAVLATGCANQQGSYGSKPAATNSAASATPAAGASAAGTSSAGASASNAGASDVRVVKSRDGRFDGEMVGTPAPGSKFAKLKIGMEFNEVSALIGGPDSMDTHETGKRWIPFYYGNDVRRMQANYKGEGCLSFTGGNHFGAGGNELVRITADPSGRKCFE